MNSVLEKSGLLHFRFLGSLASIYCTGSHGGAGQRRSRNIFILWRANVLAHATAASARKIHRGIECSSIPERGDGPVARRVSTGAGGTPTGQVCRSQPQPLSGGSSSPLHNQA